MLVRKPESAAALFLVIGLLAGGVASTAFPAPQEKPAGPAKGAKPPAEAAPAKDSAETLSSELVAERLKTPREFVGFEDPRTILGEALVLLGDRYGIRFRIRDEAFVDPVTGGLIPNIDETPVAEKPIAKQRSVKPAEVLLTLFAAIKRRHPAVDATYIIRADHVEITTERALCAEVFGKNEAVITPPLVTRVFDKVPLEVALRRLSEDGYEWNVVLDAGIADKTKTPVTARFANAPLDTVVRLLANMADLHMARLDNVLYVTTKDNAERLRAEHTRDLKERPAPKRPGGPPQG